MVFECTLTVTPKPGVRDPQGDAVAESLRGIGYDSIAVHHVGRVLRFNLDAPGEDDARTQVDEMCRRLLVNPNLETYHLELNAT